MKEDFIILYNNESWMNVNNEKSLEIKMLETWISFFVIYTPVLMIISYSQGFQAVYRGMYLLAMNLLIVYLMNKLKSRKKFLCYCLIAVLSIHVFFPSTIEKIIYSIIQVITVIVHISKLDSKKTNFWRFSTLISNGVIFALYVFIALKLKLSREIKFITVAAINNTISILIYFHLSRRNSVLAWEEKNAAKLAEGMKKTSVIVVSLFSATLIILNMMMWKLGIFGFADNFLSDFKLPNVTQSIKPAPIVQEQATEPESEAMASLDQLLPSKPPNLLIKAIVNIIGIVLILMVSVFLMYGVFTVILRAKTFFIRILGLNHENEKRESTVKESEVKDSLARGMATLRRKVLSAVDMSNRKKIRQLYKKMVKKYKTKGVVPEKYYTVEDISYRIEDVSNNSYREATELYYKARYDKDDCSEQEYKEARKIYKR